MKSTKDNQENVLWLIVQKILNTFIIGSKSNEQDTIETGVDLAYKFLNDDVKTDKYVTFIQH